MVSATSLLKALVNFKVAAKTLKVEHKIIAG